MDTILVITASLLLGAFILLLYHSRRSKKGMLLWAHTLMEDLALKKNENNSLRVELSIARRDLKELKESTLEKDRRFKATLAELDVANTLRRNLSKQYDTKCAQLAELSDNHSKICMEYAAYRTRIPIRLYEWQLLTSECTAHQFIACLGQEDYSAMQREYATKRVPAALRQKALELWNAYLQKAQTHEDLQKALSLMQNIKRFFFLKLSPTELFFETPQKKAWAIMLVDRANEIATAMLDTHLGIVQMHRDEWPDWNLIDQYTHFREALKVLSWNIVGTACRAQLQQRLCDMLEKILRAFSKHQEDLILVELYIKLLHIKGLLNEKSLEQNLAT